MITNDFNDAHDALHFLFTKGYRLKAGILFHPKDKWPDKAEGDVITYLTEEHYYEYADPDMQPE